MCSMYFTHKLTFSNFSLEHQEFIPTVQDRARPSVLLHVLLVTPQIQNTSLHLAHLQQKLLQIICQIPSVSLVLIKQKLAEYA